MSGLERIEKRFNRVCFAFVFMHLQHSNLQVFCFDIHTTYPGGWGGISI
jgi:hypothetical protein